MRRHRQRAAARARGGEIANEISIPLPMGGILNEANNAEVTGMYAATLSNWRSTGASLRLRQPFQTETGGKLSLQRIPFEFGASQLYIEIGKFRVSLGDQFILREFACRYSAGTISGSAIIVDGKGPAVVANRNSVAETAYTTSTDVSADELNGFVAHQDRPFLWKTLDELDFYYGDVGAITGPLVRFPLGRLGNITGSILTMKSLTIDSNRGINDVLAIFTTTGQIVCYQGLDPGDAANFEQIARIKVSPPLSDRCFVEVGADLWMLTASGIVSVLQTIRQSSLALVSTVSEQIQEDLVDQIAEGGEWSMHLSADALRVIINRVYNGVSSQFIYWTDTKSWVTTDYPAAEWHNLGIKTMFTHLDGSLATIQSGTEQITAIWKTSWFRIPRQGGITFIRPTIIAKGALEVSAMLLSDHDSTSVDVSEAMQTVTVEPDNPPDTGGEVALNEIIAVDAVGEVFQLTLEVTAEWAELVNLKAGVQ